MTMPRILPSLSGGAPLALAFDESKHPRGEKGSHEGGKFVAKKNYRQATKEAYKASKQADQNTNAFTHANAAKAHLHAATRAATQNLYAQEDEHDKMYAHHRKEAAKHLEVYGKKLEGEVKQKHPEAHAAFEGLTHESASKHHLEMASMMKDHPEHVKRHVEAAAAHANYAKAIKEGKDVAGLKEKANEATLHAYQKH